MDGHVFPLASCHLLHVRPAGAVKLGSNDLLQSSTDTYFSLPSKSQQHCNEFIETQGIMKLTTLPCMEGWNLDSLKGAERSSALPHPHGAGLLGKHSSKRRLPWVQALVYVDFTFAVLRLRLQGSRWVSAALGGAL